MSDKTTLCASKCLSVHVSVCRPACLPACLLAKLLTSFVQFHTTQAEEEVMRKSAEAPPGC